MGGAVARLYVKLDVDFPDNARVIEAGEKAELLYVRSLLLAKRLLSDGALTLPQLARTGLSGVRQRAERLVAVGLWEKAGEGSYRIVGWLERNRSAAEVAEVSAKRAEAGSRGGRNSHGGSNVPDGGEANGKQVAEPIDRDRDRTELLTSSSVLREETPDPGRLTHEVRGLAGRLRA